MIFIGPGEGLSVAWKFLLNEFPCYELFNSQSIVKAEYIIQYFSQTKNNTPAIDCKNYLTIKDCICRVYYSIQYIPRNMHTVFALLCFVVVIHWLIFPYPSGLLHWHCGNLTIAPVPAKQPWWIWINTSCEFIMNDCITTTKQSTPKPCAYFLGYTLTMPVSWKKTKMPAWHDNHYLDQVTTDLHHHWWKWSRKNYFCTNMNSIHHHHKRQRSRKCCFEYGYIYIFIYILKTFIETRFITTTVVILSLCIPH